MNSVRAFLVSAVLLCPISSLATESSTFPGRIVIRKSTRENFLNVVKSGAAVLNYGAYGRYLFEDSFPIDVLITVKGVGGMCYFGFEKQTRHAGIIHAKTAVYCVSRDGGSSGGSAGTGNLNPFDSGTLNLLTSLDDLPAEIDLEYNE